MYQPNRRNACGSSLVDFWGVLSTHVVQHSLWHRLSPRHLTGLKVTPIALPDPPILAASGCHGPYFLRNVVELKTEGGSWASPKRPAARV